MNIAQFLSSPHETAFSFEVLPPIRGKSVEQVYRNIEKLMPYNPAYINITTHRTEVIYKEVQPGIYLRESVHRRPGSVAVAVAINARFGVPVVPHIICSGHSRMHIENQLIDLSYLGINNIFALRGDKARDESRFVPASDGYAHADELCRQIEDFNRGVMADGSQTEPLGVPFCYGVAGYPEKHEEAMNMQTDMEHLRHKVETGAGYIVTQMFYDNQKYFDFVARAREAGITVPIVPGLKPLGSLSQQSVLPKTFHIDMPEELSAELSRCKTNDEVKELGVEWGIRQARELKSAGVPAIHFYSLNATASVAEIAKAVF